ncbi:MAG: PspA/IM30 family protein [Cyanobacteria bacterium]|nr:PspA/IM30 family protein [Cyanobacteriota bacterium]MDW8201588.1 PspA/IM30 family protein [Cyanobacteriota bacterium SKYGB_h_bin112]
MGLLNRIWQVIRANVSHLVSQAEDPEKILEQAVLEMQEDLIQLRQAVAQAIATQKRTERQQAQAQSQADEWYRRAQLALQKDDELLAREALNRRQTYLETAKTLQTQLQQQVTIVEQLKRNMLVLESKLTEAKTKKDMYIARARSAKASQNLHEMMGRMGSGGAAAAFERMEEKVLQLEAQASAVADLSADSLDQRFAALESGGSVEEELAALKAQLASEPPPAELPPDATGNG